MKLFTYGVLMYDELLHALTGRRLETEKAVLEGFHRYTLVKEGYLRCPVIVPEDGARVEGVLVRGVEAGDLEVLDGFEEVATGLYAREPVIVVDRAGRRCAAEAYVGGPRAVGSLGGSWDEAAFVEQCYGEYRDRIIPDYLAER